jgi:hypothetical protein
MDSWIWFATIGCSTAVRSRSICRGVWLETPKARTLPLDERVGPVQEQYVNVVGSEGAERSLDRADDVLVGEVEVRPRRDDARLRLDDDLVALRSGQPECGTEPFLARVKRRSVDVGVVEEVDAGVSCGADETPDLVIRERLDAHEAEYDVGDFEVGGAEGDLLHRKVLSGW